MYTYSPESVHILFASGKRCAAKDFAGLVNVLGEGEEDAESREREEEVGSPMEVKLGTLGMVGTGGRLPWAIFSANFSADLTAVGLRRLRIQFYIHKEICVCV